MLDFFIIGIAAFFAGILNTLAGGGTFLTFPALSYIGIAPVMANATSTVAVFPGYLGGTLGFRRELQSFERPALLRITFITIIGGLIGSALLLISSDKVFSYLVPFLLLIATGVFAYRERILILTSRWETSVKPYGMSGTLCVAIYGGYFNGGLGIVLLALFSLWGMRDINQMNGLKSGLSFVLSAISVTVFSVADIITWPHAIIMMIASMIGGYLGAPIARALPSSIIRFLIIMIGCVMSIVFAVRIFV